MAKASNTATARKVAPDSDSRSGHKIAAVEIHRLRLPFKNAVSFKSVTESVGQYVVLRLILDDGTEGIAESVCRPEQQGEDATTLAYQLETFFKPRLIGADPLAHLAILDGLALILNPFR